MTHRQAKLYPWDLAGYAALLWVGGSAMAALQPEQFAVGWPLELPAEQGFFDIPLTVEMYQHARSLDGLAVLDSAGEPMPFYRVSLPSPSATERRVTLSASPVYATEPRQGVAQLSVDSNDGRTNVTVTQPAAGSSAEVVAFIVDARAVEPTPLALDLAWRALEQPFLMEVRVEQSQTLTDWRLVGRASVAALSIDGTELVHGRVPVAAAQGGYYRITWNRNVVDWYLESAALISSESVPGASRVVSLAATAQRPEQRSSTNADEFDEHTLYFDVGGRLPTSTVTLDFTAANRWAKASLASSDSLEGPWGMIVDHRLFYELDYEDEALVSPVIDIGRVEARYWRVTLDTPPPPGVIELQLQYPQEYLRFAAEGTAPYTLAGGTVSDDAGPDPTFAAVWSQLRPAGTPLQVAGVGARVELGGEAALDPPFEFPWRTVLLWLVLGLGVFAVAAMAVRLAREMSKTR